MGKKLEGELKKMRSIRIWPYRIIYQVFRKKITILIVSITHRQSAY